MGEEGPKSQGPSALGPLKATHAAGLSQSQANYQLILRPGCIHPMNCWCFQLKSWTHLGLSGPGPTVYWLVDLPQQPRYWTHCHRTKDCWVAVAQQLSSGTVGIGRILCPSPNIMSLIVHVWHNRRCSVWDAALFWIQSQMHHCFDICPGP